MSRHRAASGLLHFSDVRVGRHIPSPSQPAELVSSGKRAEQGRVADVLIYLQSIAHLQYAGTKSAHSWRALLGGDVDAVSGGGVRAHSKACIVRAGAKNDASVLSFGGAVKTGVDYASLKQAHPTKRYKFYHSFADSGRADDYLTEVIGRSVDAGISLTMKSFDHAYDGINLYTYHFNELRGIVAATYPNHPDAWLETEHFLQGSIANVQPEHIGWVQEPSTGYGHFSLSGRMAKIGQALDYGGLNELAYRQGCESIGVRADKPWLLTPEYEQQLLHA